jgi:hypothetical protein
VDTAWAPRGTSGSSASRARRSLSLFIMYLRLG